MKTKIKTAPQVAVDDLEPHVDRVLEALGVEAFVTDESSISDFLEVGAKPYRTRRGGINSTEPWTEHPGNPEVAARNEARLAGMSEKLGIPVQSGDRIVFLARTLRDLARG